MIETVPHPVRCFGVWCLFGIWCLGFGVCRASAADITAEVRADHTQVRLSESVRVTLSIEGATPLRVELPDEVLDEESASAWRARPDGPATVTDLPNNKQRWARTYRLDPYLPGKPLHLGFAPATAHVGTDPQPKEVIWKPVDVTVTTEITSTTEARPTTGIEELPPIAGRTWSLRDDRLTLLVLIGILIAILGLVTAWLVRWRRRGPPPSPEEWATAQLNELAPDDPAFADRLSNVLRHYTEARTPVPATRLTTTEALAALAMIESPVPADRLAPVLEACDAAKFASRSLTPADRDNLLAEARAIVTPTTGERPA